MQGKWFAMFDNYIYGNQNAVSLYMGQNTLPFNDLDSLTKALPSLTNKLESIKALPKLWYRDLATYLQERVTSWLKNIKPKSRFSLLWGKSVELEMFLYEFLELVETYTILDDEEHYQTTRLTPIVRIRKCR
ncbi:hypothetical protein HELA111659_08590 [Helicobacter labetoulli]